MNFTVTGDTVTQNETRETRRTRCLGPATTPPPGRSDSVPLLGYMFEMFVS